MNVAFLSVGHENIKNTSIVATARQCQPPEEWKNTSSMSVDPRTLIRKKVQTKADLITNDNAQNK